VRWGTGNWVIVMIVVYNNIALSYHMMHRRLIGAAAAAATSSWVWYASSCEESVMITGCGRRGNEK